MENHIPQQTVERLRRRPSRTVAFLAGVALLVGLAAGCGDDTDPITAFCDAGDSLRADIDGLSEVDVVSGGTDALSEQLDAISGDIDSLRDSGEDVAAQEIEALDTSVDQLGTAIDSLGDDGAVSDVADGVNAVIASAQAVFDELATTCE